MHAHNLYGPYLSFETKKAKSETLCNTHPKSIELAHSGWSYRLPTKYTSYDKKRILF